MRALIAVVVSLAALWSGYWYVGAHVKEAALASWFDARRAEGWTIDYGDFRVIGFPGRFDSRFHGLDIFDPVSGIEWKAPRFDIYALAYQPNHITAGFDRHQTIGFPGETVTVDNASMIAGITFEPDTQLAVRQTLWRSSGVRLSGASGWTASAGTLNLSTRATAATRFAHDAVFDARDITPTRALKRTLDPADALPATIRRLFFELELGFDRDWDRIAIETGTPEVTTIRLDRMDLVWGKLGLAGSGRLDVAKSGEISGVIDLDIRNWRSVLDLFVTAGVFSPATARTIAGALAFLTEGQDDPERLRVPLNLKGGQMSLGPVPLGPAPYFVRD